MKSIDKVVFSENEFMDVFYCKAIVCTNSELFYLDTSFERFIIRNKPL